MLNLPPDVLIFMKIKHQSTLWHFGWWHYKSFHTPLHSIRRPISSVWHYKGWYAIKPKQPTKYIKLYISHSLTLITQAYIKLYISYGLRLNPQVYINLYMYLLTWSQPAGLYQVINFLTWPHSLPWPISNYRYSPMASDSIHRPILRQQNFASCNWARNQRNSVQHRRWTEDRDNGSIHHFKQGNRRKVLQEIPKSFGGHSWSLQWLIKNKFTLYYFQLFW